MSISHIDLYNIPLLEIWGKSMGKKIIIGSMLVLTLLLLMPSIPAIQQKSVEEGIQQDIREKLDTINLDDYNFKNTKEIKNGDDFKYPLLAYLAGVIFYIRIIRCMYLVYGSSNFYRKRT